MSYLSLIHIYRAGRHHHHARVFFPGAHTSHQARQNRRADLWHHDGLQRHAVLGGNPAGRVYPAAPRSGCALHGQGHAREAPVPLWPVSYTHLDVYKRQAHDEQLILGR